MTKVTCNGNVVYYECDDNFEEFAFESNEKAYAMYLVLVESLKIINDLCERIDKMYQQ